MQQEPGQGFPEFAASHPRKPDGRKRRIYLIPLGEFPDESGPSLQMLKDCAEAYFMMDVRVTPQVDVNPGRFTTRINP